MTNEQLEAIKERVAATCKDCGLPITEDQHRVDGKGGEHWHEYDEECIRLLRTALESLQARYSEAVEALRRIEDFDCWDGTHDEISCWLCEDSILNSDFDVPDPDVFIRHLPDCPHRVAKEALAAIVTQAERGQEQP